jgi:hypothetical protein
MNIKLFDMDKGVLVPSEHCYNLATLKDIIKEYPEHHMGVFSYLFYMSCPDPEINPFFNLPEHEKEDVIMQELKVEEWTSEDEKIIIALDFCKKLYETPTLRAYKGIKQMLDRLAEYMENTEITHGRDGNLTSLTNTAAKFDQIRSSFKGAMEDLAKEQKSQVRGSQRLAYDQK